MSTMTVMFEVAVEDSGSVMQALAPCMGVLRNFCMEVKDTPIKAKRVISGRGHKVQDSIIATLSANGGKATKVALSNGLAEDGLSPNSASPGVSALERAGKVRRLPGGVVELVV